MLKLINSLCFTEKMKDQFNFIAQDKIEVIENCYSFEYENLKLIQHQRIKFFFCLILCFQKEYLICWIFLTNYLD